MLFPTLPLLPLLPPQRLQRPQRLLPPLLLPQRLHRLLRLLLPLPLRLPHSTLWVLAAINDGTNTMSVADFAAANNVSAEDTLIYVNIDENSYNSLAMGVEGNYSYTVTENGITVDLDGMELPVTYDAESDILAYGVAVGDVTYKYVFMRNTDDAASTAEAAATAQAAATAEAAE